MLDNFAGSSPEVGHQNLRYICFKSQPISGSRQGHLSNESSQRHNANLSSNCCRVGKERRHMPDSFWVNGHNAKVMAKFEPVSSTNTISFKFTSPISCQYCTRNCCTRSVSRTRSVQSFFSRMVKLAGKNQLPIQSDINPDHVESDTAASAQNDVSAIGPGHRCETVPPSSCR